ncbi:MAG: hypothetical protein ABSH00_15035 [Bryobacteraceae bacterium]|jgi:hypothetical protein
MHRLLVFAIVLGPGVGCRGRAPTEPQNAPKEVVEQFYKMQTGGRWLGPERWNELQDFLTDIEPWSPPKSISVLKSYEVREARRDIGWGGRVDYQVEVDLFEWGSIDAFLNFASARGPRGELLAAGQPVVQRTYQTLVLTDKFLKRGLPRDEEKTGTLRWRMNPFFSPEVNVDAALRWVAEMRGKSNDPAIKYNAERTLAILKSLSTGAPMPAGPAGVAKESPSDVAHRFVPMERGSLPDQWNQLAGFFVETPRPEWNRVHIVDVVHVGVDTNGDSSYVWISTNSLGELDSSLRLSNYPSMRLPLDTPSASACYGDVRFVFSLVLSDKHWEIAPDGTAKELNGPLAWRIEDASFEPLMTLDTAIRYVRQARDKTTDPVVKMKAARTLTILKYYRQSKPLPSELSSDASEGCG